jgi:hypothetical protein
MNEIDGLILGVPKAGTTWLANVLSQNPEVILSDPKEPNIIASHKGTFGRDKKAPDYILFLAPYRLHVCLIKCLILS